MFQSYIFHISLFQYSPPTDPPSVARRCGLAGVFHMARGRLDMARGRLNMAKGLLLSHRPVLSFATDCNMNDCSARAGSGAHGAHPGSEARNGRRNEIVHHPCANRHRFPCPRQRNPGIGSVSLPASWCAHLGSATSCGSSLYYLPQCGEPPS